MGPRILAGLRATLRPVAWRFKRLVFQWTLLRLRFIYLTDGIDGVCRAIARLNGGYREALRAFGANVATDAAIAGPPSIVNAHVDLSHLTIGSKVHLGSEVFIDLADRVTIEELCTVTMRAALITHFDVGRSPLAETRPRKTAPITIKRGAFVGATATILMGVTIGELAIVPAGAVVTRDVEAGAVARGT